MLTNYRKLNSGFKDFLTWLIKAENELTQAVVFAAQWIAAVVLDIAAYAALGIGMLLIPVIFVAASKSYTVKHGDNTIPEPKIERLCRMIGWLSGVISSYYLISTFDNDFSSYKQQSSDYDDMFIFKNEVESAKYLFLLKSVYTFNVITCSTTMAGTAVGHFTYACYSMANSQPDEQRARNSCMLHVYHMFRNHDYAEINSSSIELAEVDATQQNEPSLAATIRASTQPSMV